MLVLLTACAPAATPAGSGFPGGTAFDYQLGGAYPLPDGAGLVVRDSTERPAPDTYSVCYVNGFQTQPADRARWLAEDPDLVLHDGTGAPLTDESWPDELVLDTSTAARRDRIAAVVGQTVLDCAQSGFDAVELDNLDSYLRSFGALTMADNLALATALAAVAHDAGLAVGQKNTAELGTRGRDEAGFDFAVVEECARWGECDDYRDVYGDRVLNVEYTDDWADPALACATQDLPATVVRDRELGTPGDEGYHYLAC